MASDNREITALSLAFSVPSDPLTLRSVEQVFGNFSPVAPELLRQHEDLPGALATDEAGS